MNLYIMDYCSGQVYKIPNIDESRDEYDILEEHNFKENQVEWMFSEWDGDIIELCKEDE